MGAESGQIGQRRNLQTPRFVVAQVEMQQVELIGRQDVQHPEDLFFRTEIADDVEHKSAQAKVGPVFDDHVLRAGGQLALRYLGVKGTVLVVRLNGGDAVGIDAQPVPALRLHAARALRTDRLHGRNDIRRHGLIRSGEPGSVRFLAFVGQELVADLQRPVFLPFHLQHETLRRPGMPGQRPARIRDGKLLSGLFGNIEVERRSLEMLDFGNRTCRDHVVVEQFLKPDAASGRHVLENEGVLGPAVIAGRTFLPFHGGRARNGCQCRKHQPGGKESLHGRYGV